MGSGAGGGCDAWATRQAVVWGGDYDSPENSKRERNGGARDDDGGAGKRWVSTCQRSAVPIVCSETLVVISGGLNSGRVAWGAGLGTRVGWGVLGQDSGVQCISLFFS